MSGVQFPLLGMTSGRQPDGIPVVLGVNPQGIHQAMGETDALMPAWEGGLATAIVLAPDFATSGVALAGTERGVLTSHDWGATWVEEPLPGLASPVASMAARRNAAGTLDLVVATLEDGVFRRQGTNPWTPSNAGLYLTRTNVVLDDAGTIWLGTDGGLFHSVNGGRSWRDDPGDDVDAGVTAIAALDHLVAVGATTGDVWLIDQRQRRGSPLGNAPSGEVLALDLTRDGDSVYRLAVAGPMAIQVWNLHDDGGRLVADHRHQAAATCTAWLRDGDRLTALVATGDGIDRVAVTDDPGSA